MEMKATLPDNIERLVNQLKETQEVLVRFKLVETQDVAQGHLNSAWENLKNQEDFLNFQIKNKVKKLQNL